MRDRGVELRSTVWKTVIIAVILIPLIWSRLSDSNRKPDAYKATALAVELRRHMVGDPRFELGTSCVSDRRSATELIPIMLNCGGLGGIRTLYRLVKSQMLCQVSFKPLY